MIRVLPSKYKALSSNPSAAKKKKSLCSWALAAQACNPSYSGGRDQENPGSKPALAKGM
jgi:hypothetical protein